MIAAPGGFDDRRWCCAAVHAAVTQLDLRQRSHQCDGENATLIRRRSAACTNRRPEEDLPSAVTRLEEMIIRFSPRAIPSSLISAGIRFATAPGCDRHSSLRGRVTNAVTLSAHVDTSLESPAVAP
jgi:hypothetical protein